MEYYIGNMNIYIEEKDRATAIIGGIVSAVIIPVQLLVLWTIFFHSDLWNNASYRLLLRIILLELIQTIALVTTSLFTLFPSMIGIEFLRRGSSVLLSTFFVMGFVLMYELSIFRILVVTKKCSTDGLPKIMIICEVICAVAILGFSLPVYINESMKFDGVDWNYDEKDTYADILDKLEVWFCIPIAVITYLAYLILIALIYVKRKSFSDSGHAKQEWILFLQSTFITVFYVFLIMDWHNLGDYMDSLNSQGLDIFRSVTWGMAYYWTSLLLIICNKTIRGKVFHMQKNVITVSNKPSKN